MIPTLPSEKILVLDFGSQYTQLIVRRIRELGVYCELAPFDMSSEAFRAYAPLGIILSGGPESVHKPGSPSIPEWVFTSKLPVLGICYGMQAMVHQLGGEVQRVPKREYGHQTIQIVASCDLFEELPEVLSVWMSHADAITKVPSSFQVIAKTEGAIAAIADEKRRFYGLQFHPEVTHTQEGRLLLTQFVHRVCGAKSTWAPRYWVDQWVLSLKERIGDERVLLGLSGGVDSAVVAALLQRAIGDRLVCVLIDNGLMRHKEAQAVLDQMDILGIAVKQVNAASVFYEALRGVVDPEAKRKIIGKTFIDLFEQEALTLGKVAWLAQGTIYPDVVESAQTETGKAAVIKSHHNVGGLPEKMHLKLCEPLRCLFKDEVRQLGLALGLPESLIYRHPFPGPGLAVRIIGEVQEEDVALLQKVDAIFIECLRESGWYGRVAQAFAVLLPVRSVGVMGDARTYGQVVALRAVETTDFMTARWVELPYGILAHVSNRIMNEVSGIARVTYDISSKPPATIEWE